METQSKPDTFYLERHGKRWRVPVPTTLRSVLGTRLKRVLDTESLEAANILKRRVIEEFRAEIAWAREAEVAGRDDRRRTDEAMALRDELRAAPTPKDAKEVSKGIRKRVEALKLDLKANDVSGGGSNVIKYKAVAIEGKTPIDYYYSDFTKWLKSVNPYTVGYPKTLDGLICFIVGVGVERYIESVDSYIAMDFVGEISKSDQPSFHCLVFYWDWLVKLRSAERNPFGSGRFSLNI